MKILDLIDFKKVDTLLEGFNKSTGFVTAILDLEGNVLSKSGWRQICTEFHRVNPETSKKCTVSDTVLAGKLAEGEKYHFYQCLNGLVDVAVPIVIKGEHIANLFSGQFFFEEPDPSFFKKQADKYGFNENIYLKALGKVPVVSKEKVMVVMDFLLNMTQMISDMTFQKLEQMELNEAIQKNERVLRLFVEHSPASIAMFDNNMLYLAASHRFLLDYNLGDQNLIGRSHYEVFPEISERWKEFHRRGLAGETMKESNDPFPRADGTIDWVRWEIRPWYESETQIGGIILFSEVITSQIEDREALKESEKYNRMLFEQSAIGLALTSFDGRLVDINTTFATIIGRTVEETKTLTYWDITPEKYRNQEQQQLDLLAKSGRYGPYEKEYIHKDGHLVSVRLQGLIIERNNEKFIWSSVEDITWQKLAEQKLEKSDLLIQNIIDNSPSLIYLLGSDGRFQMVNKTFESLFNLPKSEIIDKPRESIIPAKIAEQHRNNDLLVIQTKQAITIEEENVEPDGKHFYLTQKFPLIDLNNQVYAVGGISTDITERKKIAEDLRKSEERFANIFNVSPAAITITRKADGTYLNVNQSFLKIFGFNSEEVIGYRSSELNVIREEARNEIIKELIGTSGVVNAELIAHTKTGRKINLLFSSIPMNIDGEDCLVTTMIDITERKLAEEDLKKAALLLQSSIESPKDMIILSIDKNYNYLYFNECHKAAMVYAYGKDVKIGMNLLDCITNEEDKIKAKINYDKALNGESHVTIQEYGNIEKSYYETRYNPVLNDKNEIIGTTAFSSDITNRKQAEAALLQSEEKFKTSFHTNPTAQAILSQDGKFVESNEAFSKLIGYEKEQIIGNSAVDLGLLSLEEQKKLAAHAVATGGTIRNAEVIFTVRDGSLRYISYSVEQIILNGIPHRLSMGIDITERKRAEEALHKSEQLLSFSLEKSHTGGWELDLVDHTANRTLTHDRIFGYDTLLPQWTYEMFLEHVLEEDRAEVNRSFGEATTNLTDWSFECRIRRKDGEMRWIWAAGGHQHDSVGQARRMAGIVQDITERKKAEEKLTETHQYLESLINYANAPIIVWDVDFKIMRFNKAFEHLTGIDASQVIGHTLDILFPSDRSLETMEFIKKSSFSFENWETVEIPIRHANGSVRIVLWNSANIMDPGGNAIVSTIAQGQDITERKQIETERQKFFMLAESSSEFIGMCDLELNPLYVNPAGRLMVGLPDMEAACGIKVQDYFFPEDQQFITEDFFPRVLREGHGDVEIRLRHFQTGKAIWMFYYLFHVRDASGKIVGWATVSRDITDRKLAEEALRESEERFRKAFENAPMGIALTGLEDKRFISVNNSLCAMMGYSEVELMQLTLGDITYPDDTATDTEAVRNLVEGKIQSHVTEKRYIRKNGEIIWGLRALTRISNTGGKPDYALAMIKDITDRKHAEEELQKLNTELEQRVKERTAQLEAANKELETFTYSVSHDLKAPLRGIDGYSKLLSDLYANELNDEAKHFISTIRRSTQLMSQLIDDLLQYSRLERSQLRSEPVLIKPFINAILKVNEDEIISRGFSVVTDIPETAIIADSSGIQMALRNLIENALKFTKTAPEPTIQIKQEESAVSWIISVKDNGIGFDMKYSQRIFEIFQRLHRVEDYPGTGIGLAMVGKAMQRMNGRAWAESTTGQGATFYLEIPKPIK